MVPWRAKSQGGGTMFTLFAIFKVERSEIRGTSESPTAMPVLGQVICIIFSLIVVHNSISPAPRLPPSLNIIRGEGKKRPGYDARGH